MLFRRVRHHQRLRLGLTLSTIALVAVPILVSPTGSDFIDYARDQHLAKLGGEAGSGSIRMRVLLHSLSVFAESPLLGAGYGSNRSLSLLTFLLSNVGILGTVAFAGFLGALLIDTARAANASRHDLARRTLLEGSLWALITTSALLTFANSESALLFTYLWLFGAAASAYASTGLHAASASPEGAASRKRMHLSSGSGSVRDRHRGTVRGRASER